ncbi:alpha/beta fold hydrolase [Sulfitobacter sp. JL08]|uniref:alpha/beta fold hydrolase n=1 Tax=Sulfitobacter sp. JL08 TaxID=2070369 RepID=UPI0019657874|nr:alpha/beta fold hydrolase [Sulfitobacter sp. JL08]
MKYRFADCVLDDASHALTRQGKTVPVEPKVFDLLHLLARHAGEMVTRDRIIEKIWNGRIISDSAITACVAAARKAVGDDGRRQAVIRTITRRGLMMATEVAVDITDVAASRRAEQEPIQRIRYARNSNGKRLAYAVTGTGPPVLYYRSMGVADLGAEWRIPAGRAFFDFLRDQFSVLRFDPLGSGQSDHSSPEFDHSRQADDMIAVADAAGIDQFAVYSTSGAVLPAVRLAVQYPERISKLAIIGGYVDGRVRRRAATMPSPDSLKAMIEEGWSKKESAFAQAFLTSYFPEGPVDIVRDLIRMMQSATPVETMAEHRDAINDDSIADILGDIRCPTLIMHGRRDAVHPLSEAQKLVEGIPRSELVILETANHLPLLGTQAFEVFKTALADFLAA